MIIQFSHSGQELNLSRRSRKKGLAYKFDSPVLDTGIRFWNKEPSHKRKFIKHQGWYLKNIGNSFDPKPKKAELCFWGEWEPQSLFKLTGNRYSRTPSLPHAIHYPFFSTRGIGRHNTDPFVFGEHFYYTNCKQNTYRILRTLNKGTVIIYGSEKNKTDFIIDTLFVVDKCETVTDYHLKPTIYPTILRKATLDLHRGLPNNMKLYKGKMYDFTKHYSESEPYTFCFVPCKVNCDLVGFERPVIDWQKFNLQKPGAGTVTRKVNYSSEGNFWHDLVAEIIKQGFSLGVKFEMPLNNDIEKFQEYEENSSIC